MKSSTSETILALDLATKCGYAVLHGKKRVTSGRWVLLRSKKYRFHRAERWTTLDKHIREAVQRHSPTIVAYERVRRHVGTSAAHVYGGLLSVLEQLDMDWQYNEMGIELLPVEISTWKKTTVGHGNATKLDVQQYVKRRFRYTAKSEDEADALAIAEAVRKMRSETEK